MDPKIHTFSPVWHTWFCHFGDPKVVFELFRSFFIVFWEVFRHCFGLKKGYFWLYLQLKRLISDPENRNYLSKNCWFCLFWGVIVDHCGDRKSRFVDFFKVVLELFRHCFSLEKAYFWEFQWTFSKLFWNCLGNVFDLKRPTFGSSNGLFQCCCGLV